MIQANTAQQLPSYSFRALGTEVLVHSSSAHATGGELREVVAAYERRFSRFQAQSEVQRLSARAGSDVAVSRELFDVLRLAMSFWRDTGGVFDPLILRRLEEAGYNRTFDAVPRFRDDPPPAPPARRPSFGEVRLDTKRQHVCLPAGSRLDLGGIAKGWIIDQLAGRIGGSGPFLLDIGGDVAARGSDPASGPGWLVAVADPFRPDLDRCWARVRDAAICTSTTMRRRWRRGSRWCHHLIDPRTGAVSNSGLVQVTVVAPTAAQADVYAKTALILGAEGGVAWLHARSVPAALVDANGAITRTARWQDVEVPITVE